MAATRGPATRVQSPSHAAGPPTGTGPVRQLSGCASRRWPWTPSCCSSSSWSWAPSGLTAWSWRRESTRKNARRPGPPQRAGAGRLVADVLPRPVRQSLHLLPAARGDLPRQHRQARAGDTRGHGRRLPRHGPRRRAEEPRPHPRGDVPLRALRTRVPREPPPAEARRSCGAHGGRATAGGVAVAYRVPGRAQPFGQPPPPPSSPQGTPPPPPPVSPGAAWPAVPGPAAQAPEPPAIDAALARLKTAALAARGAHITYLTFSERELAADGGDTPAATRSPTSARGSRSRTPSRRSRTRGPAWSRRRPRPGSRPSRPPPRTPTSSICSPNSAVLQRRGRGLRPRGVPRAGAGGGSRLLTWRWTAEGVAVHAPGPLGAAPSRRRGGFVSEAPACRRPVYLVAAGEVGRQHAPRVPALAQSPA